MTENASVANPDPHSQNSLYLQISVRHGFACGMLDGGSLLLRQVKRCINYTHATSFAERGYMDAHVAHASHAINMCTHT